MADLVTVDIQNHVADVRLNRPDKYNSLSPEMFQAIEDTALSLRNNKEVRAVVFSGNGKGFCAGLDLSTFEKVGQGGPGSLELEGKSYPNLFQNVAWAWKQLPVPVIAALHGVVYGGGLQIALGADIRIAAPKTRLSVMEIKWGLVPDMAGSQTLRDLVRLDVAKELTFTGRIVAAEEAARIGLVTQVHEDPLAAAQEMASRIAGRSPDAMARAKVLLESAWHGDSQQGLALEARLQGQLLGSPNQMEAVMANMEKRDPQFKPREWD